MSENNQPRPADCPDPDGCIPILSGFDRTCFGRLRKKRPDTVPDEEGQTIFNTHAVCEDGEQTEVNDEDAWIFLKGFGAIRHDVAANKLYRPPGFQVDWDFAKEKP